MRIWFWWSLSFLAFLCATASEARADGAFLGFFGASTGGSISALDDGAFDLETAIENSPLFGARIGTYGFPFGFEGSLTYSPAALEGGVFNDVVEGQTNIFYTEANVLLIVLPGPVAPFVTAGGGVHYLDFQIADFASFTETKLGYNYGGGLKVNVGALALRFDVRDHVTTFGVGDFAFDLVGELFGLEETDARIHNVEVSFGIGISF